MKKGLQNGNPFAFSELLFRIVVATRRFVRTAGDFYTVKTTITAAYVMRALFHVALNRIVFIHKSLSF